MKRIVKLIVNSLFVVMLVAGSGYAFDIPEEPPIETALRIFLSNNGAMVIEFDLRGGTEWNYRTVRKPIYDKETGMYLYHTLKPVGYGQDMNGDGVITPDEIWMDDEADGINGNEVLYTDYLKMQERVEG